MTTVHTEPPDFRALFEAGPGLCLLLSPELTVVGASDSYLRATFTRREDVLLRGLFEAFPERHEDLSAEGTSLLRTSLERVLERGTSDTMPMKTVDVRLPRESGGGFEQRYFVPVNSPVFGSDQRLLYIIHRVDDVTDLVRLQRARALPTPQEEAQRIRADRREADGLREAPRIPAGRAVESAGQDLHTAILRNMTEGICLVRTEDHVIVYTNPRFDIMLGYEAGELAGKSAEVLSQYGDGGGERFEEILAELKLKGEATYEVRVLRKDKSVVWHRVHTSRLEHSTLGTVWVAVHEDISRRKESAEDLDNFFSMSLDLLGIGTFDGYFTRLNPAWERTLGWTREELMTQGMLAFVHPDDIQATTDAMSLGIHMPTFENRYQCRDGSYRWLQWTGMPVLERRLFFASARDVTEAKAAKEALRELSESLETTLHSIGDGVIATDANGVIVRMNPVAEQITGWTRIEASGRPFTEIFTIINEDTRVAKENPVEHALRTGAIIGLANRTLFVRRDGSEVPIADSCAPIRTAGGKVSGAVLVFRDLTTERHAAAVQAKYQQQLVFADRMASVGTLAAGVAHEINNPLTYIKANIDTVLEEIRLLAGGSPSGRLKDIEENLVEARTGATRVAKIVRGLKTFSRIEEERRGVVDVVAVLELAVNMAYNEIRHRARLVKDFGSVPFVDADDARLGQVFINLLVNAAQSLPEGNTDGNEIRLVTSTDALGRALVEIRDTGAGIPPALLTRVFDPFFTTKPIGIGTGLGLAICHNIITGMGGEISVQSELGLGTTFRVALPASRGALPVVAPVVRDPTAPPLRPATVLVVDDEPAVGFAVRRVLKKHDVVVVTKAQEALDLLDSGKEFDVILSDLMMPGMSGIDFHAALTQRHPKMAARVVFVTGGAFTTEANAFLDKVTNERMEKPFDLLQLREMVQKFVKTSKPERT